MQKVYIICRSYPEIVILDVSLDERIAQETVDRYNRQLPPEEQDNEFYMLDMIPIEYLAYWKQQESSHA